MLHIPKPAISKTPIDRDDDEHDDEQEFMCNTI